MHRAWHHDDSPASDAGSPNSRLAALQQAASTLLDAEPVQALALARESLTLAELTGSQYLPGSRLLLGKALLATAQLSEAASMLNEAIAGYQVAGNILGQAEAEMIAGKVGLQLGDFETAADRLCAAVGRTAGRSDDAARVIRATALNQLAGVRHTQGRSDEALTHLQEALELWTALGQYSGQTHCLNNIGALQMSLGQYHLAITTLNRAYTLSRDHLSDLRAEAFILSTLARVHHLDQDHARAVSVMRAAQLAAAGTPDQVVQATMHLNLGSFCLAAGELEEAAEQLEAALTLSRRLGYRLGELSTLDSLGSLYERRGESDRAVAAHDQALSIALEIGDIQGELEARLHLGQLHLGAAHLDEASMQLQLALELAIQTGTPRETADAHHALAEVCRQRGDYRAGFEHQAQLRTIERSLFDHERDRQTRDLTIRFEVERAHHEAEVYRLRTEVEHEARQAAETLVRERTAELARAQHEVVTRLAMAAEYRDDTTGEHTRRVGRAAARIARALGWTEQRASVMGIAARLHDVGKIGIPDTVLLKADKLTPPEFSQMQTHTLIGARILSGGRSELLRLAEEIALTHHERWDGRGYPRGLTGLQIPLTGRIVAVADVFDALTQARPYKQAWTPEAALAEIRTQAGSHFDPEVVAVALDVLATPVPGSTEPGDWIVEADDHPLGTEDATHVLAVFEQLLVERTRELEMARREAEHSAATLSRIALTDSLTGLGNRRSFEVDLEEAFAHTAAGTEPGVTLLCCDLDALKAVNDTQGHSRGDELLCAFGTHLAAVYSPLGRAYRIGGDEFVVIGRGDVDPVTWLGRMQQVMARLDAAGFTAASASAGVAQHPADAESPGGLLRVSDQRMYQDKVTRRAARTSQSVAPRFPEPSSDGH
ncbi:HD domain-containing phosphohydrolase [Deinococcus sp. A31D244]|uniref:HD domain-containing phosphohydrolase n=1 Tax=Deinococcus sp. A31D244 TaxID=3397675 RepID=UPI0039E17009